MNFPISRRDFLGASAALIGAASMPPVCAEAADRPGDVKVLNPAGRVPLSFVIDDSTCLVNMGHFCTPQFGAAFPNREQYQRPWQDWPREIPDTFVREFGTWCAEQGVKGKYSIVPNPACVGWLDRELPGWSHRQLRESLKLVRDLMVPNWDIHPEMITHTRVIDLKTGRPFEEIGPATIENSYPQKKKSVDELAAYIAYALKILKNCDLPCSGITTPGGFGNLVKTELSLAIQQAVADVYTPEIVHYFKYVNAGSQSTEPVLEHLSGLGTENLKLTVNVPAGTGDWFGGWQGVDPSDPDRYCTVDASSGRMVELIKRGEPAIMLCHWPGMYCNGTHTGYKDFKRIVLSLKEHFGDQTMWMKMSEIARYWCAKTLTNIQKTDSGIALDAPFAAPDFTIEFPADRFGELHLKTQDSVAKLDEINQRPNLKSGTWYRDGSKIVACIDLPKSRSTLEVKS